MELVLDLRTLGAGEDGGDGRDAGSAGAAGMPPVVRLVLAAAAVGAAWFVMSDGRFGTAAAQMLGRAHGAALPGPLGALFANLPSAG